MRSVLSQLVGHPSLNSLLWLPALFPLLHPLFSSFHPKPFCLGVGFQQFSSGSQGPFEVVVTTKMNHVSPEFTTDYVSHL